MLNELLKDLSTMDPHYVDSFDTSILDDNFGDLFSEDLNSHIFFVTASDPAHLPPEIFTRSAIVQY